MKNFLLFLPLLFAAVTAEGEMKFVLDGMQELMEGTANFDEDFFDALVQCFDKVDPILMEGQDAAWKGALDFAAMGGTAEDPWETCQQAEDEGLTPDDVGQYYYEFNCTVQEMGDMSIFAPCNYASNIAYYHTAWEVCQHDSWNVGDEYVTAMVLNMAYMAHGSAFYHGSITRVGQACDNVLNDLFTYLAYQAAVSALEPLDSPVLHDLAISSRALNSVEMTAYVQEIILTRPVEEWEETLRSIDMPIIYEGMCSFFATGITLAIGGDKATALADALLTLLDVADDAEFCTEVFLPEMIAATENIEIGEEDRQRLFNGLLGTAVKLLYAFLWQETFFEADFLFSPLGNRLGYTLLPMINSAANGLLAEEDFPHYNEEFQDGQNSYPGDEWCNNDAVPHAKWHLQTGIALVDLFHLADMYHEFLSTAATEPGEDPGDGGDGGDGGDSGDPDDGGDDGEGPDDDDDNDEEDEDDGASVQGRNIAMLMISIVSSIFCS